MAGTRAGGLAAAKAVKEKLGEDFYSKIGTKGGKAYHKVRGFQGMDKDKHLAASAKGGSISRRTRKEL